jgi:signal transduction histidine kinase
VTTGYDWRSQKRHKVLRALIPVRLARSARPLGLLELDQDYRAVDVQIADARGRLVMILALAFLALYASLFPILRRVTGQLRSTNRSLREQARERERLLEGERAARAEAETAQRLLTEQNERLRELDRLKDEFVSLVSHELRTPLTSIRGYLELLLEGEGGPLTPEQQRFLGIVDRNSRRLLGLVGDLLFLAQIDAGKLTIELEPVSLADVVDECVESAQAVAEARELELAASTDDVPELLGDGARLAQVLDNLISNALKFTPSGGRVEVRLQTVGREAVLEVEDNGLGIAGTEQPRLFDRFFRSSVATERAIPGSGLGLAIAKAIVERHHGAITLESAEGVGTTVRVTLPLPAPQPADAAPHEILV